LHRVGPLHPQWINETTHGPRYYGANWQASRRKARARDGACVRCGATSALAVHHIIPIRLWPDREAANALANLVTLCAACHRKVEAARQWVNLGNDSGVVTFATGGAAHELARERGML
jgi:5-methylcytosine-specific restriction endonuclease McrA